MDAQWFKDFPRAIPAVGRIAIFKYPNDYHVAFITELGDSTFIVKEANFKKCAVGTREISYSDPRLVGFFAP